MSSVPAAARLRAVLTTVLLAVLGTPLLVPHLAAPARADDAVTVTGAWHRWDPLADHGKGAYDTGTTPSVTVEQTTDLGDQVVRVTWKNFTPSSNDSLYGHAPTSVSVAKPTVLYGVKVIECTASVPDQTPFATPDNPRACYLADVVSPADGGHGQNNAVTAVTQPDGTGYADLHVENRITNDLLGCDQTHACTIVVVPNNGGNQPLPYSDGTPACDNHKKDHLGPPSYLPPMTADAPYIGGACSWADRIEVPIHFAPLPSDCPDVPAQFTATGSPMLKRGLDQLQAGWCHGSNPVSFDYNSTSSEYEARSLFGSSADVALVTRPADPGTTSVSKFGYAPVANDAIAVAYYVDNVKTGRPMTDLRLDARLVAKLLTQSYQPYFFNCQSATDPTQPGDGCAPEVSGNPTTILDDPEFQALNFRGDHPDRSYFPTRNSTGSNDSLGAFYPTVLAGDSDLTYELTRWIASDPDARSFLAGQPDAWGMKINPFFRPAHGELFPTSQLQSLDPGWTPARDDIERHFHEGFQGTWNPITGLDNVSTTLVGNRSTAVDVTNGVCPTGNNTDCRNNPGLPVNFPRLPAEPVGARDLWAVVDNSDASAYRFPTAELVNAAGNAVGPTPEAMSAALASMATDADHVTQYVDHAHEASDGYPLTEPVYAMVQQCGLPAAKAAGVSRFLDLVATSQTYGVTPGTLAPGLLQLSPAQVHQTTAAARTVSAASCTPPHHGSGGGGQHHGGSGGGTTSSGGGTTGGDTGLGGTTGTTGTGGTTTTGIDGAHAARPAVHDTHRAGAAPRAKLAAKDAGYKPSDGGGSTAMMLPILLLVGAAFLVGAPLVWLLTSTSAGAAAAGRLAFWR